MSSPAPASFRDQLLAAIPRLRRYARSLVFDAAAADDLVQTALERALARWRQFDPRRELLVWVIGIAHNAHLDERRRQARRREATTATPALDGDGAQLPAHHAIDRHGGHPGVDVALRLDLLAALRRLPEEQREALLLVSVEQFTYAECAEALGIPAGTAMSRVSRGRAALRAMLDGDASTLKTVAASPVETVATPTPTPTPPAAGAPVARPLRGLV